MRELLFAYGTLQQPEVQQRVMGRLVNMTPDVLVGYRQSSVKIDGTTYPIAVKTEGESLVGSVLEIEEHDLPALDEYETEAYQRVKVILESGTYAWVYCRPS